MILGFKPQFKEKILSGSKIHSIRIDKNNRWKPGKKIHLATGVRTKNYECFKEDECRSVQSVEMKFFKSGLILIAVDGKLPLHREAATVFIKNDGFEFFDDFYNFFVKRRDKKKNFRAITIKAKIIHWTNFKY